MKASHFAVAGSVAVFICAVLLTSCRAVEETPRAPGTDTIRVVDVRFFPLDGENVDIRVTGDWGESLAFTRRKVDSVESVLISSLKNATRYHGYDEPLATPSLDYSIAETYEFLEPLPVFDRADVDAPMTDYRAIMERIDARRWVEREGVTEFWIWAYHGGVVHLWESNMSSPWTDVSNSDRKTDDLPVFTSTYTVYHYNYQRGPAEAMENHMHQLEALLNHFDGRDSTAYPDWPDLLFWGKFVGSDSTHHLLSPIRAGWSHYPPNAGHDYEWANSEPVQSDIMDWKPDGTGTSRSVDCSLWSCDHLDWFIFWSQNIPGLDNGLSFRGRPLRNWWRFVSDTDTAFRERWRLWR